MTWSRLIAVSGALAVPMMAIAQDVVTIYGKIDTSLERVRSVNGRLNVLSNNASRLGFRGAEDLGGGLKALFGLEFGFSSDTGAFSNPPFRSTYVGIAGGWGTVNAGRLDSAAPTRTPLYALVTRHTEFVIHDAGSTAVGTSILNARTRVSNAIGYMSPSYQNVVVRAGRYLNGEGVAEKADGPIRYEGDLVQTDLSLSYGELGGPVGLGIGYGQDRRRGGAQANDLERKWMIVASYDFGPVRAWGIFNRDHYRAASATRDDVDVKYFGASIDIGSSGKLIANAMTRDLQSSRSAQLKRLQAGYLHRLSLRTSLYGFFDVSDPNDKIAGDTIRAVGVGVVHNF